jgi:hypothetical protein
LLVVVLSVVNISSTYEIVQLALGDFVFIGPLTPMSPRCDECRTAGAVKRKRALPWEIPRTTPVIDLGII